MSNIDDILSKIRKTSPKLKNINLSKSSKHELQEWKKSKDDFFYFLNNYVKLNVPGENIKFEQHEGQEFLSRAFFIYHYLITLKSRQLGITTIIRALVAWVTIFHSNVGVGIISKKGPDATAFVRGIIRTIEQDLPSFLIPTFSKKSEQQFFLKNGSYAIAEAVSPSQPENTLRSNPITLLIIDEAAFVHKISEALSGLLPTIVTAHKFARQNNIPYGVIVMSTPNKTTGTGKWFFDMYRNAVYNSTTISEDDDTVYRAIKLHWKDIPFYANDPNWYQSQKKMFNYDKALIAQELDCTFIPSDKESIIDTDIAIELSKKQIKPINVIKTLGGEIWQFKEIDLENKKYLVGIDTATASGDDAYSAIQVIDFETCEQVIEYMGKLSTLDYPTVIMQVIKMLGLNFYIIAERNTIGEPIVTTLSKNLIIKQRMFKSIKKNPKTGFIESAEYGLKTTGKTKPLLVEALTTFIEDYHETIYSERLILQILSARIKRDKLVGLPNDLLLALSFCAFARKYTKIKFNTNQTSWFNEIGKNQTENELTKEEFLDYIYTNNIPMEKAIKMQRKKIKQRKPNFLDYLYD